MVVPPGMRKGAVRSVHVDGHEDHPQQVCLPVLIGARPVPRVQYTQFPLEGLGVGRA